MAGVHPPGKRDEVLTLCTVIRNLLLGHRLATAAVRAASAALPTPPTVCMALNHIWFTTHSWNPLTNFVRARLDYSRRNTRHGLDVSVRRGR